MYFGQIHLTVIVVIYTLAIFFDGGVTCLPSEKKDDTESVNVTTTTTTTAATITSTNTNNTIIPFTLINTSSLTVPPPQQLASDEITLANPATTTPTIINPEEPSASDLHYPVRHRPSKNTSKNSTPSPPSSLPTPPAPQVNHVEEPIIEISTGLVRGYRVETLNLKKHYWQFKGIPYAEPPVGDLRFNDPLPIHKWNGILSAKDDPPNCIQFPSGSGSEDCLFLNVFTPKLPDYLEESNGTVDFNNPKLPVMVWFHGGSFETQPTNVETYSPDYLIEEDVIVVTFNYRMGIFGFLSTEDYAATGNWGLKDQISVLKWIKENIGHFGGDSNRVTVFGNGIGAACISLLMQCPSAKGYFHRAILQSGTNLNPWSHAVNPKETAFAVGKLLDINTYDSRELIKLLRKIDRMTLQIVSTSTDLKESINHNPLSGLLFAPTTEVYHSKAVFTNMSSESLRLGDFHRVPVIVGFNSLEAVPFAHVINQLKPYVQTYDVFSTRLVPHSLNIDSKIIKFAVSRLIHYKYFGLAPIMSSNSQLVQFVTDDQFARSIYEYVKQSSKYTSTYFYIFSYEGPLGIYGQKRAYPGVGHSEECNYIWHKESNINNAPHEDGITRRRLIRLWTNFAKTGNPTPTPDDLLENVTWPPANIRAMVYLNISSHLALDIDVNRYNIPLWDDIYRVNGRPPYDTY